MATMSAPLASQSPNVLGVDSSATPDLYRYYAEGTTDHQPVLETEIVYHQILFPYSTSTPLHGPDTEPCDHSNCACRCELFPEESLQGSSADGSFAPDSRPFPSSATPSLSSLGMNPKCEGLPDQANDHTDQGLGPFPEMDDQDSGNQGTCYQSHPPSDGEEDKTEATALLNCSDAEDDALDGSGDVLGNDVGHEEVDPAREFESSCTESVVNCSRSRGNIDTKDHFNNNNNDSKNVNQNNFRGGKNKNNKYNRRGGGGNNQGGNNNYNRNNGNKKNKGQNGNNYSAGYAGAGGDLLVDVDGAPNADLDQGDGVSLVDPLEGQGRSNDRGGSAPWGVGTAYLFGNESSKK